MGKKFPEWTKEKLFNFRPCLFSAVFFAAGIIFSFFVATKNLSPLWLLVIVPFVLLKLFFSKRKKKTMLIFLAFTLFFAVGFLRFWSTADGFLKKKVLLGEYAVVGTVVALEDYGYTQKAVIDDLIVGDSKSDGKMIVYLPAKYSTLSLSNRISMRATINTHTRLFEDGRFLSNEINDGVYYYTTDVESVQVIGNEFNLFLFLRDRMQKSVSAGMDADVAAVTIGVLTGDTSFMDWSFLQNVRYGGVAHLFAVSGLHVGVVYGLCFFLFNIKKLTHIPKIIRFLCMSALLLFYGGICGFSPSVIRAIVTCLCFYAFILVGFRRDMLEIIGVAGVATMAIQPVMIFNVGFQLSFAACLGIALMDRPLYRLFSRIELLFTRGIRTLFHRTDEWDSRPLMDRTIYTYRNLPPPIHERIRRNITSFFAATVAAQIGTLPIQLMTFGYVSGVGLLLNCIFVPIMSAVFGVLIAFVILATALPIVCAPVVLYVPFAVWSLLLLLFYATDYSAFSLSFVFPPIACVSYFATFLFWSDKLNLSKPVRAVISVAFAIVCVLTTVFANI